MHRAPSLRLGWWQRAFLAARRAGRFRLTLASIVLTALALSNNSAAWGAFPQITGTLSVRTTSVGPQSVNVATGAPVQTQALSPFPNTFELAVASFNGLTEGDRLFDFETSISGTTGAPFGQLAVSSATFTQNFTTTGPRWLQLTARAEVATPAGDPNSASASVSLGRIGQPAAFVISADLGNGTATREGAFASGNFTINGTLSASASNLAGVRSAVLDGFLLNAAIADFDGNKVVNQIDLGTWAGGFGLLGGSFISGNLDGDSDTDGADFLLWQRQSGTSVPLAVSAAIMTPEPTSLALSGLAVAALMTSWRRRRRKGARGIRIVHAGAR